MRTGYIAVTALVVLIAGCDGGIDLGPATTVSDSFEFTESIDTLRIDNPAGEIEIEGSDTDKTTIERTIRHTGDQPNATAEVSGETLKLDIDCGTRRRCEVDYMIQIPTAVALELNLASASVSASGLAGAVSIDTASGSVGLTNISGDININCASGSVRLTDIDGNLDINTASGSIDGSGLVSDDVRADSASGSVDLEFDAEISDLVIDTASGSVAVRVPGGPYRVETDSSSGDIDVNIATDPSAAGSIRVETASGRVTIDPA